MPDWSKVSVVKVKVKVKRKARLCVVCGAQVKNMNPLTTTCDEICTRARKKGRSRYDQILEDLHNEETQERVDYYGRTVNNTET